MTEKFIQFVKMHEWPLADGDWLILALWKLQQCHLVKNVPVNYAIRFSGPVISWYGV